MTRTSLLRVTGLVLAWIALAVFNVFALLVFAGWVGAADAFLPWSLAALFLWTPSRKQLHLPLLRATRAGRVLIGIWLTLVVAAGMGIDERDWGGAPMAITVIYLLLPVVPAALILGAALYTRRQPRLLNPALLLSGRLLRRRPCSLRSPAASMIMPRSRRLVR
jgi:hypothetical protein